MTRTREQMTQGALAGGFTDASATPYAGPVKSGQRFDLGNGRVGEVWGVLQASLCTSCDEGGRTEYVAFWAPRYYVSYRSVNPKTDRPWQGAKNTTPERVLANLVRS